MIINHSSFSFNLNNLSQLPDTNFIVYLRMTLNQVILYYSVSTAKIRLLNSMFSNVEKNTCVSLNQHEVLRHEPAATRSGAALPGGNINHIVLLKHVPYLSIAL